MVIQLVSTAKTASHKSAADAAEGAGRESAAPASSLSRSAYALLLGETLLAICELRVKLDKLKQALKERHQ
ncbi:MAG: hypothetical protein AAAB35_01445 [Phyllobacterium sp.]|uniref:hypothetical protein n=1 Tax=Phyllobacterium sp. TaxID=1871046 RepID=UPI0030F29E1C